MEEDSCKQAMPGCRVELCVCVCVFSPASSTVLTPSASGLDKAAVAQCFPLRPALDIWQGSRGSLFVRFLLQSLPRAWLARYCSPCDAASSRAPGRCERASVAWILHALKHSERQTTDSWRANVTVCEGSFSFYQQAILRRATACRGAHLRRSSAPLEADFDTAAFRFSDGFVI